MKVHDLPVHQRPREKLQQVGAENLSNKELLAIFLRTGRAGKSVLEITQDILKKFPEETLLSITHEDLKQVKGLNALKKHFGKTWKAAQGTIYWTYQGNTIREHFDATV